MYEPGAEHEVAQRDGRAHEVVGAHHLRTSVPLEGAEDVVLGAVGEAVKEQVNAEEEHAPGHIGVRVDDGLLLLAARVQRKDGDAGRDARDDEVLVQRVALAKERRVEEHDGH